MHVWSLGEQPRSVFPSGASLLFMHPSPILLIWSESGYPITAAMLHLTKEQQRVLCFAMLILLTGLAVKAWRLTHLSRDESMSGAAVHSRVGPQKP